MTQPQETNLDKAALNAFTDLYYLYTDIVFYITSHRDESPEAFDIFYLRGGLRELILKYYRQSDISSLDARLNQGNISILDTIAAVTNEVEAKISENRGIVKGLNDSLHAYGVEVANEVVEVVKTGRKLIENYRLNRAHLLQDAYIDLASTDIDYIDSQLKIGQKHISIERDTIQDFCLTYIFDKAEQGEQVSAVEIADWVKDQPTINNPEFEERAVKDALRDVNKKVQKELSTELELFDLSKSGKVIRNY